MLKYFILPLLESEILILFFYVVISMFHNNTTCRNSYKGENLKCYQVWHIINSCCALDVCTEFTCE